jgi:hypothetical protein
VRRTPAGPGSSLSGPFRQEQRWEDAAVDGSTATTLEAVAQRLRDALPPAAGVDPEGCEHCVTTEDRAALRARTPEALQLYLIKAMNTWGTEEDFLRLLPELLDEAVTGGAVALDDVVRACHRAGWATWPEQRRSALRDHLAALWADVLAGRSGGTARIDALVTALAEVHDDVGPFLDAWAGTPDPGRQAEFADFVVGAGDLLLAGGGSGRSPADRRILSWLLRPSTAAVLEAAFFAAENPERARLLSEAAQRVEWLAAARDWTRASG